MVEPAEGRAEHPVLRVDAPRIVVRPYDTCHSLWLANIRKRHDSLLLVWPKRFELLVDRSDPRTIGALEGKDRHICHHKLTASDGSSGHDPKPLALDGHHLVGQRAFLPGSCSLGASESHPVRPPPRESQALPAPLLPTLAASQRRSSDAGGNLLRNAGRPPCRAEPPLPCARRRAANVAAARWLSTRHARGGMRRGPRKHRGEPEQLL
mmetsp:Transcript_35048/g.111328  ORF Transcript_35048/g.111328 Transcript_35048/m.111328 type:complete len:209 (-) Transcript_35048:34-660(-)